MTFRFKILKFFQNFEKSSQPKKIIPRTPRAILIGYRLHLVPSKLDDGKYFKLISKDSNIGEAVILDKDYPNFTISEALYKLPITKNKFYFFAFSKHHYFREQLSLKTPKGSIFRHAKTLFLECEIPFPNQRNSNDIVRYIESLVQAIINKEKEVRKKNQFIFDLIEKEPLENQKESKFKFENPKFSELLQTSRFDASYHCYDYK